MNCFEVGICSGSLINEADLAWQGAPRFSRHEPVSFPEATPNLLHTPGIIRSIAMPAENLSAIVLSKAPRAPKGKTSPRRKPKEIDQYGLLDQEEYDVRREIEGDQKILHHHRVQEIQSCAKRAAAQKAKAAAAGQKAAASSRRSRRQCCDSTPTPKREGDGDGDPDPDRRAVPLVLDQEGLANLLLLSKKTVQNIASVAPHKLPRATYLPCSKAPRYLRDDVLAWLYSYRQAVEPPPRKVGRPRIATQRP